MFTEFKIAVQQKIDELLESSVALFEVDVDKDELWNLYLDSFPAGTNEIYRERRKYDCSCCRQFIRNYGSIIGVVDGQVVSIWDIITIEPFQTVANSLKTFVLSKPISNVFYSKFKSLGTDYNFELIGEVNTKWEHFYYNLPIAFVLKSNDSIETAQSKVKQTKDVVQRSFEELTPSSIDIVLELIAEKSLYRGEEFTTVLTNFRALQRQYITHPNKAAYCWQVAVTDGRVAAIRNTAIGTLLVDISNGVDLDTAVDSFGKKMDPTNYKRVKAIFTPSMKKAAEDKVTELGLMDSLERRYARLTDISVRNVIWASGNSKKVMKNAFDLLGESNGKSKSGNFDYIEEIGIEQFVQDIIPTAESIEVFVENSYKNNFLSLIAPVNANSPSLFKWNNGFSWSYNGDFTDSIKESVKTRGGKVDGALRCSLSWAEGDRTDNSDLDLHCKTPHDHIYYANKNGSCRGQLDVDIQTPNSKGNKDIVENITWSDTRMMAKGKYHFYIRNFALRGSQKGFIAQIEFNGQIHDFVYDKPLRNGEEVMVATIIYDGVGFTINPHLPSTQASKSLWNINTMSFVPVTAFMYSPNYWDNQGVGNKHYFFMLENCINRDDARGFFNEFLRTDLLEHKRVFEALGSRMKVEHSDDQLSGLGFSSTMSNSIVLKINSKPLKVNFTNDKLILKSSKAKVQVSNSKGIA